MVKVLFMHEKQTWCVCLQMDWTFCIRADVATHTNSTSKIPASLGVAVPFDSFIRRISTSNSSPELPLLQSWLRRCNTTRESIVHSLCWSIEYGSIRDGLPCFGQLKAANVWIIDFLLMHWEWCWTNSNGFVRGIQSWWNTSSVVCFFLGPSILSASPSTIVQYYSKKWLPLWRSRTW